MIKLILALVATWVGFIGGAYLVGRYVFPKLKKGG